MTSRIRLRIVLVNLAVLFVINVYTSWQGKRYPYNVGIDLNLATEMVIAGALWIGCIVILAVLLSLCALFNREARPRLKPYVSGFLLSAPALLLAWVPVFLICMKLGDLLNGA